MENIPMLPVFFCYCRRMGRAFLLAGLGFGMLFLVTVLYRAPLDLPIYACSLVGTVGLTFFAFGFGRYCRRHAALRMLLAQCGTKLAELPAPRDLLDEDYHELIETLEASRIAAEAEAARQRFDAAEYYTLWSHQIKTPLAAMRLLLQDTPELRRRGAFMQELFLTEQYVDLVLGYQRLGSIHADLEPRALALEPLVRDTVKRMSALFIYNKSVSLQIAPLPGTIVTDTKWFSFVLEQLLTNAVKYTPAGTVRIYPDAAAPDTLVIEDTGIGIRPEDLPRIFERGFTGGNGRGGQRSTGIGLYLCREVLQKLGHTIAITSAPNVGTVVRVGYARGPIEVE